MEQTYKSHSSPANRRVAAWLQTTVVTWEGPGRSSSSLKVPSLHLSHRQGSSPRGLPKHVYAIVLLSGQLQPEGKIYFSHYCSTAVGHRQGMYGLLKQSVVAFWIPTLFIVIRDIFPWRRPGVVLVPGQRQGANPQKPMVFINIWNDPFAPQF